MNDLKQQLIDLAFKAEVAIKANAPKGKKT